MMVVPKKFNVLWAFLFLTAATALSSTGSIPPSVTFPSASGYATKVYNVSAATTTLSYSYTNEELAMLWNQVGKIAIGPITTTVIPTPEPSAYPRPGVLHPQVTLRMPP